jgi:8-oxo-dGTP diphosphatase
MSDEVQAAGGLIVDDAGRVAVVHRPRYDDWSLPKGKLDPGETFEQAALREVEEETGLRCRLGRRLTDTHYRDRHDRPKLVQWWAMEAEHGAGEFAPNDEVSKLEWLSPEEAGRRLVYDRDRELVTEVVEGQ